MKRKKGFTLVETLISFMLIVITALLVINVLPSGRRGMQLSENHVHAAYLGRGLLDEMRKMEFSAMMPVSGSYEYGGINNGAAFSQNFMYNIDTTDIDKDKKLVWTTVSWDEATGRKNIILETIIFNANMK